MSTLLDAARSRAARLKLMAFDVDGVLSDGKLYYTDEGSEIKAFSTLDGHGMKMLRHAGIKLAIITGRTSGCVAHRAANLGIDLLFQGVEDKAATLRQLLRQLEFSAEEAGYMGDDVVDLPIMNLCGFSAAPANAHALVRRHARFVSEFGGGEGAVREVCEFVLLAQDKLGAALAPYLATPTR